MYPYSRLARQALQIYLEEGRVMKVTSDLPPALLSRKAGVFVTIEKRGSLRGCIGTFLPAYDSIAEEIIHNSIAAGTQDYRFPPVPLSEMDALRFTVSVLTKPELVRGLEDLDPRKYGVIVEAPRTKRKGLLLPDLEGINTPDKQVEICMQKGGIDPQEKKLKLYRFTVVKHRD